MKPKHLFLSVLAALAITGTAKAAETSRFGVVNFSTCVTDSKYGKHEQSQFEKIRGQWGSMIEETEKELKDISGKFEDQDYLDGLSPEAEEELKVKYRTLYEDLSRYQSQLNQVLSQANYFFIQRMSANIAKAAEALAKSKKLEMNKNFDQDVKDQKITEAETADAKPVAAEEPVSEPKKEEPPVEKAAE